MVKVSYELIKLKEIKFTFFFKFNNKNLCAAGRSQWLNTEKNKSPIYLKPGIFTAGLFRIQN